MGRIWRVAMILLVAVSLVGCGGAKATQTKPATKKPVKKKITKAKKKPPGKTKIGGVFGGIFLDEYRTALKSSDPDERVRGCVGLGNLGERAIDALGELKEVAARDKNKQVRLAAQRAIKEIEE